jgi:Tfp pilus assembly protein PilO
MAETLSRGGYKAESKPELFETLLSKLKTKDDRYQRKAAAGMLLKLKSHIPEATKALQEMLFETPGDLEIEQLLKETDSFSASGPLSCKSRLGSLSPH